MYVEEEKDGGGDLGGKTMEKIRSKRSKNNK